MRDAHVHTFAVPPEAIDINGHVNNLEYLRWMQDVATRHSAAQGWPIERYLETRTSWVIRSHFIEYLRPAFAGESLSLMTWIPGFGVELSPRRYLFWRASDRQVVARAESVWVFVDAAKGRARRIPDDFRAAFDVVTDEKDVLRHLDPGLAGKPTAP
jgi:acyl-CoA thioester hydrolase